MVSKNTSVFGLSSDYLPLLVRCSEGQTPSIHDIHLNTLLSANNDVVSSAYDVALSDWSLDSPFPLCSICLLFRNFGNVVLRVFPASHPFHLATISFVTRTRAMFSACPLVMGSFTSVMACASISRIGLKTSQGYTVPLLGKLGSLSLSIAYFGYAFANLFVPSMVSLFRNERFAMACAAMEYPCVPLLHG